MTIQIWDKGMIDIVSPILGNVSGNNLLIMHLGKVLWEHPDNTNKWETRTANSRLMSFDYWAERIAKE